MGLLRRTGNGVIMKNLGIVAYATMLFLSAALWCAEASIPKPVTVTGTIVCVVPPEDVRREGTVMVAKEVTGSVTIKIAGRTYTGTLTFPDTKVRRKGVGYMVVDQCVASGVIQ